MIVVAGVSELRNAIDALAADGKRTGFVPTMGFLHEGHIALIERAREVSDVVVASIFVNPSQFGPTEDLATYPRDIDGDHRKLEAAGCDILFQPDSREVYPEGFSTFVVVGGVSSRFEGEVRPTHFKGVATVVAKLFNIVRPHVAVFGQKDAQQVAVIKRMVADLNMQVAIEVVDTVREPDGLARSSRNIFLSEQERAKAIVLSRALRAACDAVARGETLDAAREAMNATLLNAVDSVDYADIVDEATFEPAVDTAGRSLVAIVAARLGRTRLIDNMPIGATQAPSIKAST